MFLKNTLRLRNSFWIVNFGLIEVELELGILVRLQMQLKITLKSGKSRRRKKLYQQIKILILDNSFIPRTGKLTYPVACSRL